MSSTPFPLAPGRRQALEPLFAGHGELWAVVGGVFQAGLGRALADDPERPAAARLSVGCYEIFGGDAAAPAAPALAREIARPRELVYGNDPAWRRLLLELHGAGAVDRPMQSFESSGLRPAELQAASGRLPSGFELVRLDAELARQLDAELEPHALQVYPGPEAFAAEAVGFGALQGGRLAAAATSYAACPGHLEVAIATRPAFRGRGLALAVAARLLLDCLERGLDPRWNASNPVSQRLARRLGYRPAGRCEVLWLA